MVKTTKTSRPVAGVAAQKRRVVKRPAKKAEVRPGKAVSGRQAGAAARREAIVTAGLEEFIARGFDAARLEDIARRAGVGKGTIYLHFKDKEALFQELIRTAVRSAVRRQSPGEQKGRCRASGHRRRRAIPRACRVLFS